MRLLSFFAIIISFFISGCNTIGGFGQDLSETGKALGSAASWSQNQIQDVAGDESSTLSTGNNYNNTNADTGVSDVVVEEPSGMQQY